MKSAKSNVWVLDSFALLAYLQGEPGMPRVQAILAEAQDDATKVWMSLINFGEVVYAFRRRRGLDATQDMMALVDHLPVHIAGVDRGVVLAAANIKATRRVSYADAFAVALAQEKNAKVVTGDPEFKQVEDTVRVAWL